MHVFITNLPFFSPSTTCSKTLLSSMALSLTSFSASSSRLARSKLALSFASSFGVFPSSRNSLYVLEKSSLLYSLYLRLWCCSRLWRCWCWSSFSSSLSQSSKKAATFLFVGRLVIIDVCAFVKTVLWLVFT